MSRTNLMESIQNNLKESDSIDRFSKGVQTVIADNGYECKPTYEEGMVHFIVGYNNYHLLIGIYAADEPSTQYGVDTICIGGDTEEETLYPKVVAGWDYDDAAPGVNKEIKVGDEVYVIYNDINKTSVDEVGNIINDIFDPVVHGNEEDGSEPYGFDKEYELSRLHEGEEPKEQSLSDKFLNYTINVYDVDAFIKSETENKHEAFDYPGGAAIILGEGGKGCIADYEAIYTPFESTDKEIKIPANDITEGKDGKRDIYLMPQYLIKTNVEEIIEKAPSKEMKASEFFKKYNYNSRCESNFEGLVNYLTGIGFFNQNESNITESAEDIDKFWSKGIKAGDSIESSGAGTVEIIDLNKGADYILLKRNTDYQPFVAAWAPQLNDGKLSWGQGHYFTTEEEARNYFNSKVDGEEFTYESAKVVNEEGYFKGKDIEKREGTEDKKQPKSDVSYYIVGEKDFQKLLKLNGGAFDSGYLAISTAEANKLANKQGLIANDSGIFSDK